MGAFTFVVMVIPLFPRFLVVMVIPGFSLVHERHHVEHFDAGRADVDGYDVISTEHSPLPQLVHLKHVVFDDVIMSDVIVSDVHLFQCELEVVGDVVSSRGEDRNRVPLVNKFPAPTLKYIKSFI